MKPTLEPKSYEGAYIAQEIKDILYDRWGNFRLLNDFSCDTFFTNPDIDDSALESFIKFIANRIIGRETLEADLKQTKDGVSFSETGAVLNEIPTLPVEEAFEFYGIDYYSFREFLKDSEKDYLFGIDEDDIGDYLDELDLIQCHEDLCNKIIEGTLPILLKNPKAISIFNGVIADYISNENEETDDD